MVADCRDQLMQHFTTADLDAVADLIISKASDRFLDKCLEKRLPTIEAKPLINALARAERLGYEKEDVVPDDDDNNDDAATKNTLQPSPAVPLASHSLAPPPRPQWQCDMCFRIFIYESAFHHVSFLSFFFLFSFLYFLYFRSFFLFFFPLLSSSFLFFPFPPQL
jgi:hypothetical protein